MNRIEIVREKVDEIYSYAYMNTGDHAHKSAEMARKLLNSLNLFSVDEKT